jgi:hypothetical protein
MMFHIPEVLDNYLKLKKRQAILYYQGPLLYPVIAEMSQYMRYNISENLSIREKVFYIFIEMAQNVRNYSAERTPLAENGKDTGIGLVVLQQDDEKLQLTTCNLVREEQIPRLKERIARIATLDRKALRELKSELRNQALLQNHHSGNIGLVDIALKSGNPIEAEWLAVEGKGIYFLISATISKYTNTMEDLIIEGEKGTYLSPDVHFSAETGICEIKGESYQEETFEFFNKLTAWLNEYTEKAKKPITFNFKLSYFNTSSSRAILDMLAILKKYKDAGGQVEVNWYYLESDDNMLEEAEDFQADAGLNFNLIPMKEEA